MTSDSLIFVYSLMPPRYVRGAPGSRKNATAVTTRGVLHPEAIGAMFFAASATPTADLAPLRRSALARVLGSVAGASRIRSQVLPHPCVHLVFEPGGAAGPRDRPARFERRLSGAGWAVGTKFLPGGCPPFGARPVTELTDRVTA